MDFPGFVSSFAPRNFPEKVIVTHPPYFENLEGPIERTSAEALQASQAALQLAPFLGLNTELWKAVNKFNQALNGIKRGTPTDREKR
jgi:endothelin-converting enzyme